MGQSKRVVPEKQEFDRAEETASVIRERFGVFGS